MNAPDDRSVFLQIVLFLILAVGLGVCNERACTAPESARLALESAGYSDIKLGNHAWLACAKDDSLSNTFRARNAKGVEVSGAVCCGLFKGCTIRY